MCEATDAAQARALTSSCCAAVTMAALGTALPSLSPAKPVPRYYFHFSDGKRQFSDASGQDLLGIAAARAHAMQQVREIKAAMCHPQIQDLSGWTLTAVDGEGRTVCEIGFDLRPVRVSEDS